jgi:hypothetical protein
LAAGLAGETGSVVVMDERVADTFGPNGSDIDFHSLITLNLPSLNFSIAFSEQLIKKFNIIIKYFNFLLTFN